MKFKYLVSAFLLFVLISGCSRKAHVDSIFLSHQYLANAQPDSLLSAALKPYKAKHDSEMNEIVAFCEEPLLKGQPEGNLGNFVSDCLLERAKRYFTAEKIKIDAVLLNNGGLRVALPKGEITKGKMFELMPFDNEMVVAEISGTKFLEMLRFVAEKGGMPVAGIRMEINSKKKPINVFVGGLPFDSTSTYHVVSSDYLISGGDNITFFAEGKKFPSRLFIRDVLLDYCREQTALNKSIEAKIDGRISFSK